jgi:hypothetical protein
MRKLKKKNLPELEVVTPSERSVPVRTDKPSTEIVVAREMLPVALPSTDGAISDSSIANGPSALTITIALVSAAAMLALWLLPVDWRVDGVEMVLLGVSVSGALTATLLEVRREGLASSR